MLSPSSSLSLADLATSGIPLSTRLVVTIVRTLAQRVIRGDIAGVPSAQVIRLSAGGGVSIEGPVPTSGLEVTRTAALLESLLPGFDADTSVRVPGALRLLIARALGTVDLPPFASLSELVDALERFGDPDASATIQRVMQQAAANDATPRGDTDLLPLREARAPLTPVFVPAAKLLVSGEVQAPSAALTISDIRRARRATGVTLLEIARESGVPVRWLREWEWGYLRHWPADDRALALLTRYAEASGLDIDVVLTVARPLLEDWAFERALAASRVVAPAHASLPLVEVPAAGAPVRANRPVRLAAVVAATVVLAASAPSLWQRTRVPAASGPASPSVTGPPAEDRIAPAPLPSSSRRTSAVGPRGDRRVRSEEPVSGRLVTAKESRVAEVPGLPAFDMPGSAAFAGGGPAMGSVPVRAEMGGRDAFLQVTRVIDDRARTSHARLSPDGTQIAFDSDRDGERAVFVADATGQHVRRVSGRGFAAIPSWSPDGRMLAYVRAEPDQPRVWNLWTTEVESGTTARLTSHGAGQLWGASWFPDGQRVAYGHDDRLVIHDVATGRAREVTSPVAGRQIRTPAVAPDGRRVMFQVEGDGAWLFELADQSLRRVLSDATADQFTWAADGRRVAYHSGRSGDWGVWVGGR